MVRSHPPQDQLTRLLPNLEHSPVIYKTARRKPMELLGSSVVFEGYRVVSFCREPMCSS